MVLVYTGPMRRRVVITGTGSVSCFGVGTAPALEALISGASGIAEVTRFDASTFAHPYAAQLPDDFKVRDLVPKTYRKAVKVMARDTEIAVAAAKAAVTDAGLVTGESGAEEADRTYPSARFGCQIGAGLIAAEVEELAPAFATSMGEDGAFDYDAWGERGMQALTPLWLLKYLPNMLACHVTILHEARGPSNTITNAQASGLLSLGESRSVIERGDADCCMSGSAESKLNPMGLERLRLAEMLGDVPAGTGADDVVRAYAPDATSSAIGEGGGILIVEALETAEQRGATVLAELVGFGAGQSPTRGDEKARSVGLSNAIRNALCDADLSLEDIDVVFPEASGAPGIDRVEAEALRTVFGDRLPSVPMIAVPRSLGHTQAGSGGLMASIAALALSRQEFPAPLTEHTPATLLGLSGTPAMPARVRHALVCTGAIGGQNAAIVLRAPGG